MRLIDADRLIDNTDDRYSLGEIGRRKHDDIVSALEYAPTVPQWIPCSERLPAESGDYLCTYGSLSGWFVDISIYETTKKEFGFYSDNERGEEVWHPVTNVVAWMELPKPYGGGKQEGTC